MACLLHAQAPGSSAPTRDSRRRTGGMKNGGICPPPNLTRTASRARARVRYFNRVAISFAIAFVAAFVGASVASAFSRPKSWMVPS